MDHSSLIALDFWSPQLVTRIDTRYRQNKFYRSWPFWAFSIADKASEIKALVSSSIL